MAKKANKNPHPRDWRTFRLRTRYGLTPEDYDKLLAEQGGVCGICGIAPSSKRRLDVDHDHKPRARTQEAKKKTVRGLTCHRCNRGLPWFRDDPDLLRKAADYLQRYMER